MKKLFLILVLLFGIGTYAQNGSDKSPFIRVYNLEGQKISKGRINNISDTSLILQKNKKIITIAVSDIGMIKTKHSTGNNFLMGAITGAGMGIILGAGSGDEDRGILGVLGTPIGGVTALFKNSEIYLINGDDSKWQVFKKMYE
jgi:hypothetical protein